MNTDNAQSGTSLPAVFNASSRTFRFELSDKLELYGLRYPHASRGGDVHTMKYAFILFGCVAVFAHAQNEIPAPKSVSDPSATFLTALKATAGDEAIGCGAVEFNAPRAAAFECAESALNDGKAFWVALRVDPSDPHRWFSASRNKSGTLFLIESNSDIGKGKNTTPLLSTKILRCSWLKFQSDTSRPIVCQRPRK